MKNILNKNFHQFLSDFLQPKTYKGFHLLLFKVFLVIIYFVLLLLLIWLILLIILYIQSIGSEIGVLQTLSIFIKNNSQDHFGCLSSLTKATFTSVSTKAKEKEKTEYNWKHLNYKINNLTLSIDFINNTLQSFWKNVMNKLNDDQYVLFIFKVQYSIGNYASLSSLQKINKNDFILLLDILKKEYNIKLEEYKSTEIINIIYSYTIIPSDKLETKESKLTSSVNKSIPFYRFFGYNFPSTMDYSNIGKLFYKNNKVQIYQTDKGEIYNVEKHKDYNLVKYIVNGLIIKEFKDYINDPNNMGTFTRIINGHEYTLPLGQFQINNELVLKKLIRKTSFIKTIKQDKNLSNKFLTLDIETRVINDIITPYCISIYDGNKAWSFYLSDFKSINDMLIKAINSILIKNIMVRKYMCII
jgi:hypothetical protein